MLARAKDSEALSNNRLGDNLSYHHILFHVGNAAHTAHYYCSNFGFKITHYKPLNRNNKCFAAYVVRKNNIIFVFKSCVIPYYKNCLESKDDSKKDAKYNCLVQSFYEELCKHGDFIKDVCFRVDDCFSIYDKAIKNGAESISPPNKIYDQYGFVISATIKVFNDTVHSFVQLNNYNGDFLPEFQDYGITMNSYTTCPYFDSLKQVNELNSIDHFAVSNKEHSLSLRCEFYAKILDFYKFWTVDDSDNVVVTEFTSFKSIVLASRNNNIKITLMEPSDKKLCKSQIQEFNEYNHGSGIQHLALNTSDIVSTVRTLISNGVEFLNIPETYYEYLEKRLKSEDKKPFYNLSQIKKLGILVDFDDFGHLFQIFTKPLHDRPTFFIEIIQRCNFKGFGAGNVKALFEAVESEQRERGNLV